jgi:2-O-methyltransferase
MAWRRLTPTSLLRWLRVDRRPTTSTSHPASVRQPSRATYIASPSPIAAELRSLFADAEPLVIFDIGSCEGEDAIRYARLFPKARVFALEPLPANLEILRANVARYALDGAITVLDVAASDRSGTATFHVSSGQPDDRPATPDWDYGNKSSSLLAPDRHREIFPWITFEGEIDVTTARVDELCERLGLERIDFVHLDVQGAELAVLDGAGRILETVRAIWMEVEAIPLYRGQPVKADVEAFMIDHGFAIEKDTVGSVSGDQLYVRKTGGARG